MIIQNDDNDGVTERYPPSDHCWSKTTDDDSD